MSVAQQIVCQDERPVVRQLAFTFSGGRNAMDRKRVEIFPRLGAIRLSPKFAQKRTAQALGALPS
jgi:hypothetical protein